MPRNYTARNKSSQPLATGSDHVEVLHGRSRSTGDVEIAHPNGERWNARMIALADLKRYCDLCADNDNVFISQGRFRGRRRIVNLSTIGSLWVDLDYYKTDLDDLRPERVSWHVRRLCDREKLPQPSYILSGTEPHCDRLKNLTGVSGPPRPRVPWGGVIFKGFHGVPTNGVRSGRIGAAAGRLASVERTALVEHPARAGSPPARDRGGADRGHRRRGCQSSLSIDRARADRGGQGTSWQD